MRNVLSLALSIEIFRAPRNRFRRFLCADKRKKAIEAGGNITASPHLLRDIL